MALLADGHLLVEGAPGLAKTKAIKTLADGVEGDFHRIQFTPDLLPSDITGTEIYRAQEGTFEFQQGPGHPPRFSPRCWKQWPKGKSASAGRHFR